MTDREIPPDHLLEDIKAATGMVNDFYQVAHTYPVSIMRNSTDNIKAGLLPWAKSGIRKSIFIKVPGITINQIAHEMSHYSLRILTGNKPLPLWFDEGLACYVSSMDFIGGAQNLKTAYQRNTLPNIISWKGLHGKFTWLYHMYLKKNTPLIYGQSFYMIEYLIDTYQHQHLLNFVKHADAMEFDDSFKRSFGISQDIFYRNFLNTLQ